MLTENATIYRGEGKRFCAPEKAEPVAHGEVDLTPTDNAAGS